ncbi:hypothetical protein [Nocardiopsis oceani]
MADTKEADRERKEPAKKGLHGWKAAATIFGCGTLAAFGVFGVFVGVLSLFFSTASSGIPTSDSSVNLPEEGIGESRSDLEEGQMDVCGENLDPLTTIQVERQDSGDGHLDTTDDGEIEIDGVARLVKDECLWEIAPHNSTPWDFSFTYEAIIDAESGQHRDEIASVRYEELKSELPAEVHDMESESETPYGEPSYSVYGVGEDGQTVYVTLIQTRSAVYSIRFEDRPEQALGKTDESEFTGEARKISNFLANGFEYWIPE